MKKRKNTQMTEEEFIKINKLYNQFIVQKNKRDRILGDILYSLAKNKIEKEKPKYINPFINCSRVTSYNIFYGKSNGYSYGEVIKK